MPCPPSRLPISLAFALITASAAAQSTPDEALIADIRDSVAHDLDAAELGPIYGAMVSITTAPEISAATYRVRDDEAPPTMRLYKLPLNWTLPSDDPDWAPYVQTSLGFMEMSSEMDVLGERILSSWRAYGGSVGLGARMGQGPLTWIGLASVGLIQIENRARYDGTIGQTLLKPVFEGLLFDWDATAHKTGLAIGADYERDFAVWRMVARGRLSTMRVKTFSTSSPAVEFASTGSALTLHTDHSRPLPFAVGGYPARVHVRSGATAYLGSNRAALGFDRYLELGGGLEIDVSGEGSAVDAVHLSALGIWGPDVVGWSLSVSFGF
ncbi:MAG: hypothetical protein KDH20_19000 [Rhodocyclaceae bacterium]|nr:hypothetical protein [Rhodocyclaceae bacterium]